jgi:hypothetical protein
VAKYQLVAEFLCNCHTTFYGNQISLYFNADVMSLEIDLLKHVTFYGLVSVATTFDQGWCASAAYSRVR